MEEMTYTSIFMTEDQEVTFSELSEEDKAGAANQTARLPLEELGNVHIVKKCK